MSELTERRIASLLHDVQLDVEDRTRLEQRLREQCDRERERLMGLGYNAHHAEVLALQVLPDPWDFGAPFELTSTTAKVLLVCAVMAAAFVLIIFLYRVFEQLRVEPAAWMYVVLFVFACVVVWMHRWTNRVDLRGGVLIRRWFRPPVHIAMNTICSVRRNGWHLGGRPTWVVLVHDGGKLRLPWILHGLQGALLALDAVQPGLVEECLLDALQPGKSKLRPLTRRRQVLFSMPWLIALLAMAWHAHLIWTLETWPVIAVAVFFVTSIVGMFMLDYVCAAKTTIAGYLLACWVSFVFAAGTWGFLIGQWGWARGALVAGICSPLLAMAFLWWRGKRGALLLTSTVLMVLAVAAVVWSTPGDPWPVSEPLPSQAYHTQIAFLDDDTVAILEPVKNASQLLLVQAGREVARHVLPDGYAWIRPQPPGSRLLMAIPSLHRAESGPTSGTVANRSDYWVLDAHNTLAPYAPAFLAPEDHPVCSFTERPWSSDGRMLASHASDATTTECFLRIYDCVTGTRLFEDRTIRLPQVHWTTEGHLRVLATSGPRIAQFLTLWEIDPAAPPSQAVRTIGTYQPAVGEEWDALNGLRYLVLEGRLLDLETGKHIPAPVSPAMSSGACFAWDAPRERLVYAVGESSGIPAKDATSDALEILDLRTGDVIRRAFDTPQRITRLRFSPDGQSIVYTRRHQQSILGERDFLSSAKTELWDLASGSVTQVLAENGVASSIDVWTSFPIPFTSPLWSPSGKVLMLPRWRMLGWRAQGFRSEEVTVTLPPHAAPSP